jgi:hypothetical protein
MIENYRMIIMIRPFQGIFFQIPRDFYNSYGSVGRPFTASPSATSGGFTTLSDVDSTVLAYVARWYRAIGRNSQKEVQCNYTY